MTRVRTRLLVLLLLFGLAALPASAGGDANLLLGQKWLSDAELEDADVDRQGAIGVAVTLDLGWPVDLAFDLAQSSSDESQVLGPTTLQTDVDTLELDLGVRKSWGERLRPFVGGGLAWVRLDTQQTQQTSIGIGDPITSTVVDDSGSGAGIWLNAGLAYLVGSHFNVGADLRWSDASADLQPEGTGELSLDAGGIRAAILLGYHW